MADEQLDEVGHGRDANAIPGGPETDRDSHAVDGKTLTFALRESVSDVAKVMSTGRTDKDTRALHRGRPRIDVGQAISNTDGAERSPTTRWWNS
jgi:hypothetical protein